MLADLMQQARAASNFRPLPRYDDLAPYRHADRLAPCRACDGVGYFAACACREHAACCDKCGQSLPCRVCGNTGLRKVGYDAGLMRLLPVPSDVDASLHCESCGTTGFAPDTSTKPDVFVEIVDGLWLDPIVVQRLALLPDCRIDAVAATARIVRFCFDGGEGIVMAKARPSANDKIIRAVVEKAA